MPERQRESPKGNLSGMEWNRSETLALAAPNCAYCHGLGRLIHKDNSTVPCKCVFRSIFRICYQRFRDAMELDPFETKPSLTGNRLSAGWSRKNEEYMADFYLVSRRTLTADEWRIFNYHFLLGADWRLCCLKLRMDRGDFFHEVYRIQQKLGRVYRELTPYALFPLDEYFHNVLLENEPAVAKEVKVIPIRPVQPPLKKRGPKVESLPKAA